MAIDKNGYICEIPKAAIQSEYISLLHDIQKQLLALYGDKLCAIFIYGSVARGEARQPTSDLDLCVILNKEITTEDKSNMTKIENDILAIYSIVPKVDFDITSKHDVLLPDNLNSWGYWLKHHCRLFSGENFASYFQLFQPSRTITEAINGDYYSVLSDYIQRINNIDDEKDYIRLSEEVSKKLIRSTNILRPKIGGDWPYTIDEHINRINTIDPNLVEQLV